MKKTLLFEATVKELKNTYTTIEMLPEPWNTKPIMKKVVYGVELQTPTSFRCYELQGENGIVLSRTWVFGDLEINPQEHNAQEVSR